MVGQSYWRKFYQRLLNAKTSLLLWEQTFLLRWSVWGEAVLFPVLWQATSGPAPGLQLRRGNGFSRLSVLRANCRISLHNVSNRLESKQSWGGGSPFSPPPLRCLFDAAHLWHWRRSGRQTARGWGTAFFSSLKQRETRMNGAGVKCCPGDVGSL